MQEVEDRIRGGTPEAEYLHWQLEACGNSVQIGETLNITFDEKYILNAGVFKGRIHRNGKDIIVIPSQGHMPRAREVKVDDVVIPELSWYPNPKPQFGETWMTKVLTYWAHDHQEYVLVQIVKKLTERSI